VSFNAPWNQKDKLANKNGCNNRYADGSLEFQRGDTIFANLVEASQMRVLFAARRKIFHNKLCFYRNLSNLFEISESGGKEG